MPLSGFESARGTPVDHVLIGTDGPNVLDGDRGDDTIVAAGGDDTITATDGHDQVKAGAGDDEVHMPHQSGLVDIDAAPGPTWWTSAPVTLSSSTSRRGRGSATVCWRRSSPWIT